jgi:ribosomal protein S10
MNELKIHDIKSLVEVPDYSFYLFYGLISLGLLLILFCSYFIYRFLRNKKENTRKKYFNILKNLDFTNTKQSAYDITKYGQLLVINENEKQLLENLTKKLTVYKYKKDVDNFDTKTKALIDIFIDSFI